MKRGLLVIGLAITFLLLFNVIAQDTPVALNQQTPATNANDQIINKISNNDLSGVTNVGNKANSFFEQNIIIPSYLDIPAKILFGINQNDTIPFNVFIVLIALWVGLLLILHNLMEVMSFFGKGTISWIGAVIVNCLIAVSGGIKESAIFFFDMGNKIAFMREFGILTLILAIILIFAIWFAVSRFIHILKGKEDIEIAKQAAIKTGAGI